MKKLILLLLLILIGCSKEPVNRDNLNFRNGTFYILNSDQPYSGPVFGLYQNGRLKSEGNIKDGLLHGPYKTYYYNGQVNEEGTYKDGKLDGLFKVYNSENGQLKLEGTWKDGELIESKEY